MGNENEVDTCFVGLGGEFSRTCTNTGSCPDLGCPLYWMVAARVDVANWADPDVRIKKFDS